MNLYPHTNGWGIAPDPNGSGRLILERQVGPSDIDCYDVAPLTAMQTRALAAELVRAADEMEGK